MRWKNCPHFCPFMRRIHRLPVCSSCKEPAMRGFDFVLCRKPGWLLIKKWNFRWLQQPWASCDVTVKVLAICLKMMSNLLIDVFSLYCVKWVPFVWRRHRLLTAGRQKLHVKFCVKLMSHFIAYHRQMDYSSTRENKNIHALIARLNKYWHYYTQYHFCWIKTFLKKTYYISTRNQHASMSVIKNIIWCLQRTFQYATALHTVQNDIGENWTSHWSNKRHFIPCHHERIILEQAIDLTKDILYLVTMSA